jgi:hypothetical protein
MVLVVSAGQTAAAATTSATPNLAQAVTKINQPASAH